LKNNSIFSEQEYELSWVELCEKSFAHNLKVIQSVTKPQTTIAAVIKGNAYGHGIEPFLGIAQRCGLNRFMVATVGEAHRTLQYLDGNSKITVMGLFDEKHLPFMLQNDIEFFVCSLEIMEAAITCAKELGIRARIHLEVETGSFRSGFEHEEFCQACQLIKEHCEHLDIIGLCTQLSGAGKSGNEERVAKQYKIFHAFTKTCKSYHIHPEFFHLDSSISTLTMFDDRYNLVRIGTSIYGIWVDKKQFSLSPEHIQHRLKPIIRWKTHVHSTKIVPAGEFIGYGRSFQSKKGVKVALLPVGYYDGYRRKMPSEAYCLIHGKKAPVIGVVNMNSMLVDISHIEGVKKGDEVLLLGEQNGQTVFPEDFFQEGHLVNGIEFPCKIRADIPRIVI
jgi:alanine racemase